MLRDPATGQQLAEQLAQRYRLVLVDEFQDTDRLQWEVFDLAFAGHRLITVGDPKQAIYRFRGADVHAYLEAVRTAERATLDTNHRSDRRLLDALDVLFHGATLGHPDIAFRRVDAAPDAPHSALGDGAALHVRVVPDDPSIPRTSHGLGAVAVQRVVLADVAVADPRPARHGNDHATGSRSRRRVRPDRHRRARAVAAPGRRGGSGVPRLGDPVGPGPDRVGAQQRGGRPVAVAAGRARLAHARPGGTGGRPRLVLRPPAGRAGRRVHG